MGIPVAHGYGMTECPMIAQGSPHDSDDQLAHTDGHPVYGCDVSVVSFDGTEVAAGCEGEVRVSGPLPRNATLKILKHELRQEYAVQAVN